MKNDVRQELVACGERVVRAGLVAGAGGNISARDGDLVWMKPSGLAMDDLTADDFCGLRIDTGEQVEGAHKPTSEYAMHMGLYRIRPDIRALVHTHSPWASGVISSGAMLRPMFAEFVVDLGRVRSIPYVTPTTQALADAVAEAMREGETLFMENHGILAVGTTLKQALYRCLVVEDAAKSMVAAAIVGTPRFFTQAQVDELLNLDAAQYRMRVMDGTPPS